MIQVSRELIEKAFDYRGDVTVRLKDGGSVIGYIFNREYNGTKRCSEPYIEIIPSTSADKHLIKQADIVSIEFTGEDAAAGKSWEEWIAKEEAKKAAAAAAK